MRRIILPVGLLAAFALWQAPSALLAADVLEATNAPAVEAAPLVTVEAADQLGNEPSPAANRNRSRIPSDGPWYAKHEMRLRTDGNLPGTVRRFDSSGNLVPVRARLYFIQDGRVIANAVSENSGSFQVVSLPPGVYSVVVAGTEGVGAFAVRILPRSDSPSSPLETRVDPGPSIRSTAMRQETSGDELTLEASLVGPNDFATMSNILQDQIPNFGGAPLPPAPLAGNAASGAGVASGGGSGFGAALAAAGIGAGAAIAIANDDDDDSPPTSPVQP